MYRTYLSVVELRDNNHFVCFQSNTKMFYYLTYWRQVSVIRLSSGHLYINITQHNLRDILLGSIITSISHNSHCITANINFTQLSLYHSQYQFHTTLTLSQPISISHNSHCITANMITQRFNRILTLM
jgi:hypothetical protein